MSFVKHDYVSPWDVTWYWFCVPVAERRASSAVADALGLLLPGAHADVVDLIFQVSSPLWWEKRLAAWKGNWQIVEEEIETEDEPIRIYTTDAAWAGLLFACQLTLGCGYGDGDCPSRPSYSAPTG